MDKAARFRVIADALYRLDTSPLVTFRIECNYQPVVGEGDLDANVFFVGEAPGKNEAESGRPFCGRAGRILDGLLKSAGLAREEVFITNIVKDRPPGNRRPTASEVEVYSPLLIRQIEIIQPKLLVTLGSTAARFAFDYLEVQGGFSSFGEVVGQVFDVKVNRLCVRLYPLYHPAYAIYNREILPGLTKDFQRIPELVDRRSAGGKSS